MKIIKRSFINSIATMLGAVVIVVAEASLMTTCWWLLYQPEAPDLLRKHI